MPRDEIVVDVVEGLAEADKMEPTEMDYNLSEYIDPEILEKLEDMQKGQWEFTFRVSDHQVRITHRGTVFIDGTKHVAESGPQR